MRTYKRGTNSAGWMAATILGGAVAGGILAAVLRCQGFDGVIMTRRSVIFAYSLVVPASAGRVKPGYFACGLTAWGTGVSRIGRSYRRGTVVVEEYYKCYEWR